MRNFRSVSVALSRDYGCSKTCVFPTLLRKIVNVHMIVDNLSRPFPIFTIVEVRLIAPTALVVDPGSNSYLIT